MSHLSFSILTIEGRQCSCTPSCYLSHHKVMFAKLDCNTLAGEGPLRQTSGLHCPVPFIMVNLPNKEVWAFYFPKENEHKNGIRDKMYAL